ncbi:diphthamide biosynthesis enzyme Dph2 [Candidatus Micrarchaeota archaeon]|nr:MAG: diphthamide biosynthesis enzyme Dph2 [Candidatus Micrarchaeota archaeon]
MRLLLQFPEGLKAQALEKAREYEEQGHEVFISSAPCFGACDLALEEAKAVKADKIIHFGHSEFTDSPVPVEYIEYPMDVKYDAVMKKALKKLKKYKRIGLLTTVQHVHQIPELREALEKAGKQVKLGKGRLAKYEGQVLGCDAGAASSIADGVDAFLYFGGGEFHPGGVNVEKPLLIANPFSKAVEWFDLKRNEKFRKGRLTRALLAKTFGILVSTKAGQFNVEIAQEAKRKIEEQGKRAEILVSNYIDFDALQNFRSFDAYINTACPRLRDDQERAKAPVLNMDDLAELLKLLDSKAQ